MTHSSLPHPYECFAKDDTALRQIVSGRTHEHRTVHHAGVDMTAESSYINSSWCTDMWRGFSSHSFFVTLLALQLLVPPTWVKHGLDCLQRCRLAATTGAHCPLMEGAHQEKSTHHCHEQASATSSSEWRCHCSHASSSLSTLDIIHFVLPQRITVIASSLISAQASAPLIQYGEQIISPPDPPPRSFSLSVL